MQRRRQRGGHLVAVVGVDVDHLLLAQLELPAQVGEAVVTGLVGYDEQLVEGQVATGEQRIDEPRQVPRRQPEHPAAVHPERHQPDHVGCVSHPARRMPRAAATDLAGVRAVAVRREAGPDHRGAGVTRRSEHRRRRAVAEDPGCPELGPVQAGRRQVGGDQQHVAVSTTLDQRGHDVQPGHEPETARVDVPGRDRPRRSELLVQQRGVAGQRLIGSATGADDQVDVIDLEAGGVQRLPGGPGAEPRGAAALDVPHFDAGRRLHRARRQPQPPVELEAGQLLVGQRCAGTEDPEAARPVEHRTVEGVHGRHHCRSGRPHPSVRLLRPSGYSACVSAVRLREGP